MKTLYLVPIALVSALQFIPVAAQAETPAMCGSGEPATGEPIKIGAIVGQTGPADFSTASTAAAALFDCVNANGGNDGQPIEYMVEDDA